MVEAFKRCTKCGEEKPATSEFFYKARTPSGLEAQCQSCRRAKMKAAYQTPEGKAKAEQYAAENREAISAKRKAAYQKNKKDADWVEKMRISARESARRQRLDSPERIRASQKKYKDANKEKARQADRRRRSIRRMLDPVGYSKKIRESNRRRYLKNPEKYRAYAAKQRAARLEIAGEYTGEDLHNAFKRQCGMCFYCGCRVGREAETRWEADHFIPVSRGGTNDPSNIVIACMPCNRSKHDKMPWDWMPEKFSPPQAQQ